MIAQNHEAPRVSQANPKGNNPKRPSPDENQSLEGGIDFNPLKSGTPREVETSNGKKLSLECYTLVMPVEFANIPRKAAVKLSNLGGGQVHKSLFQILLHT